MYFTLSRIEEGTAVLAALDSDYMLEVGINLLYADACEGDVINVSDGKYIFEKELTQKRKNEIKEKFERIKSGKNEHVKR